VTDPGELLARYRFSDLQSFLDLHSDLIMCFLWDRGAEAAGEMLTAIMPFRGDIIGVGLDSTEIG
jgi:hypothetical protein